MELKGVLKKIHPTVTRGNFESRKIWVTTDQDTNYPQTIELEASGKNIGIFNNIPLGAGITCHINLKGREWKNKQDEIVVFNTIQIWRVETNASHAQSSENTTGTTQAAGGQHGSGDDLNDSSQDLPF